MPPAKNKNTQQQSASRLAVAAYFAAVEKAARNPGLKPSMTAIAAAHGLSRQALTNAVKRKYALAKKTKDSDN